MRQAIILGLALAVALTGPADAVGRKKRHRSHATHVVGFGTPSKHRTETNSSSCGCSGRNYCVGPRGGHYCITSGGNKRYL